jgi:hypothetical protein
MAASVRLERDEADLILSAQRNTYQRGGLVVVALIGHNQSIATKELGGAAWLNAAEREGWEVAISDETLGLISPVVASKWREHKNRVYLKHGHLEQSMRYYRNARMADWTDAVLRNNSVEAKRIADEMAESGDCVWIARDLKLCKQHIRTRLFESDRFGLIGSGQGRRLAAEGLFVDRKPSISDWMLLPSSDCRSSNALEEVQNQFQVQGLELDGTIVCWDVDLRRTAGEWASFKMSGNRWLKDKHLDVALNSYRVLLTRSRRETIIFIPFGDLSHSDHTRNVEAYEDVFGFLVTCGARQL